MNKQDLVYQVSIRMGVSKRVATEAIDTIFDSIKRAVERGERMSIPGFGSFDRKLRAPRSVRNPQTGAKMTVPAAFAPVFRPSAEFKKQIAKG
jgi:DNA-binding protein HU-beta